MKKKKSILAYVITNFLIMLALVGILAYGAIQLSSYELDKIYDTGDNLVLEGQLSKLKKEQYSKVNLERLLGDNGYYEVLDSDAKVIYSSNTNISNNYSKDMLEYISEIDGDVYYYVEYTTSDSGEEQYIIYRYSHVYVDEDGNEIDSNVDSEINGYYSVLSGISVTDTEGNILYTTIEDENFSKSSLKFLLEDSEGITLTQKYSFKTNAGEERYLILHSDGQDKYYTNTYTKTLIFIISIFIALTSLVIVFFTLKVVRAIKKPVDILQDAMVEVTKEQAVNLPVYNGPRELEQVLNSFQKMSDDLKESKEKQAELENEKQKMLADISHDLKTPITVIQGYADAINSGIATEEQKEKYLSVIQQKSEALTELINSFYEFSRLEHPDFALIMEEGDLCEYFREYIAYKYDELDLAGFNLEIEIPEKVINAKFDKTQLKRVFENIISNSVKHNSEGTTIFAALRYIDVINKDKVSGKDLPQRMVVIYLGDDGEGIPLDLQSTIFKPFVVGDEARTSGKGTGLGLSIAKGITEAHGGVIKLLDSDETELVTDVVNLKSVFEIDLPL